MDFIEEVYRTEIARAFRIMIAAEGTLPLLAFHFLDMQGKDISSPLNYEPQPMTLP
jgi:hypothetical protein